MWTFPSLTTLSSIHTVLLNEYGCQEALDVPQAQQGHARARSAQVAAAWAAGALVAPTAPPAAAAPGADAQQNRSLPLVLPQLNCLHKIFQQRGMGANINKTVCIPQQCAISQQLIKKWQPYLLLQHRFGASCLGE